MVIYTVSRKEIQKGQFSMHQIFNKEIIKKPIKIPRQEINKSRLIEELKDCQKFKTMLSIAGGRINTIPTSLNLFNGGIELELSLGSEKANVSKDFARIAEKLENYMYTIERMILEDR